MAERLPYRGPRLIDLGVIVELTRGSYPTGNVVDCDFETLECDLVLPGDGASL